MRRDLERARARTRPTRIAAALSILIGATATAHPHTASAAAAFSDRASAYPSLYALRLDQRAQRSRMRSPWHSRPDPHTITGGAVLPVTSCADDADPGTLRNVIATAGEGDTIDLSALSCGTITLTEGPIDLSVLGDHHINDLAIVGPGADALTIDGNGGRVLLHGDFQVGLGTLAVEGLTIANGNYTHGLASCIDSSGRVALDHAIVTGCHASGGGPLTFGGAVSAAYLDMTSSAIVDSSSAAAGDNVAIGGGAYVADDATLIDSTISGNTVTAETPGDGTYYLTAGAGLYVRGGLTMSRSTISGNTLETGDPATGPGGGIFVRAGTDVSYSTFSDNAAPEGGALYKAVFSHYGDPGTTLAVANSTFAGNSADAGGGAITSARPTTMTSSTVAFNDGGSIAGGLLCVSACTLALESTLFSDNVAASAPSDIGADAALTVSGSHDLVRAADSSVTLPPDTLDADPLLAALADNGGPTATIALGAGSPAIDAGDNPGGFDFDQRGDGFARVAGAAADIGAFEVQSTSDDTIFEDGFDGAPGAP